jgi:hypothetical protein
VNDSHDWIMARGRDVSRPAARRQWREAIIW